MQQTFTSLAAHTVSVTTLLQQVSSDMQHSAEPVSCARIHTAFLTTKEVKKYSNPNKGATRTVREQSAGYDPNMRNL